MCPSFRGRLPSHSLWERRHPRRLREGSSPHSATSSGSPGSPEPHPVHDDVQSIRGSPRRRVSSVGTGGRRPDNKQSIPASTASNPADDPLQQRAPALHASNRGKNHAAARTPRKIHIPRASISAFRIPHRSRRERQPLRDSRTADRLLLQEQSGVDPNAQKLPLVAMLDQRELDLRWPGFELGLRGIRG